MRDHKIINIISSITTIGDFITLITIMVVIEKSGFGILNAAYGSVIKHLGVFFAALISNFVFKTFKSKTIFILTQVISAIFSLIVIISVKNNSISLWILYSCIFFITLFQQVFSTARDSFSKIITEDTKQSHFKNQSSILVGLFGAQTLGPLIAFILIKNLPLYIPLGIDFLTFIIAAGMATFIFHNRLISSHENYISTIKYIFNSRERSFLYLLRSVGFWFGIGLVNFLIFLIISHKFNLTVVDISFVFIIQGAGAFLGNVFLRKFKDRLILENWKICLFGHLLLGLGCFFFLISHTFLEALVPLFISAIGAGINLVSSQTIRREIITQNFFNHFIAAELILGRFSNWVISSIAMLSIENGAKYEVWYLIGVGIIIITGFLHYFLKDDFLNLTFLGIQKPRSILGKV